MTHYCLSWSLIHVNDILINVAEDHLNLTDYSFKWYIHMYVYSTVREIYFNSFQDPTMKLHRYSRNLSTFLYIFSLLGSLYYNYTSIIITTSYSYVYNLHSSGLHHDYTNLFIKFSKSVHACRFDLACTCFSIKHSQTQHQ